MSKSTKNGLKGRKILTEIDLFEINEGSNNNKQFPV